MIPLSEVLSELAERVKRFEDSFTDTAEKGKAALQSRRQELEDEFERKKQEFDDTIVQAQEGSRSWWAETRTAVERQVTAMRTDFDQWQKDLKGKNAERAAENAEENASAAMALANYFLNAAEWAAVQARLARAEVDEPSSATD
ncbi:hypothetical protein ABQE69_00510 [Mycolicibacillus trivialis]